MAGMYTAKLNSIRDIVRLVSEGEGADAGAGSRALAEGQEKRSMLVAHEPAQRRALTRLQIEITNCILF